MIIPREYIKEACDTVRADGATIVFTNGCFDILHAGHIRYLTAAEAMGDFLVIGLNSDASVRRLKGEGRPVVPEADRAEVLDALRAVDIVTIFDEPTAEELIRLVRPNVYVKGGDYTPDTLPEAIKAAYEIVDQVSFENAYYRHDIGARALRAPEG